MAQHAAPQDRTPLHRRDKADKKAPRQEAGTDEAPASEDELSSPDSPAQPTDGHASGSAQKGGRAADPDQTGKAPSIAVKRRRPARIAAAAAAVVVAVVVACGIGMHFASNESGSGFDPLGFGADAPMEAVESPAGLKTQELVNPDVYAWITVPDAPVDEPVMQNAYQDNLYLAYDVDGRSDTGGGIYSQQANAKDFSDPVTVLYGHTFEGNDSKFGALHKFEDAAFFDSHPSFYIYTPGHRLTYEVVAAVETGNAHILNTHDFADQAQLQAYFDEVLSSGGNVRDGASLTAGQDTIVQLSTCTRPADDAKRFIVTGKLVADTPTF